ncbi:MAG: A/G-specific adenine glycosylase [Clostridia bacterium]|nr:A/G-specific adenine glycosylase [Clostridia bacterium]
MKQQDTNGLAVTLAQAVEPLVAWYRENWRPLPWREEPTPYHVWVSEIMLQQTRIAAVIPYYHRFLAAYPTVEALAATDDETLMKLWEGLGYYSRARNLKAAALRVVRDFGGRFPADRKTLLTLPGVGDYTAGAIASIAFGAPEPAVDGNVLRVVSRLCDFHGDVSLPESKRLVSDALRAVYPSGADATALTQGLMELGERVCGPAGRPACVECPLSPVCLGLARNTVDSLPVKSGKKPRRIEERTVLLVRCGDRYVIRQRPEKGLLAGLWEFPAEEGSRTEKEAADLAQSMGVKVREIQFATTAKHVFTHVEWHMKGYLVTCDTPPEGAILATREELLSRYAIPRAYAAFLQWIGEEQKD